MKWKLNTKSEYRNEDDFIYSVLIISHVDSVD